MSQVVEPAIKELQPGVGSQAAPKLIFLSYKRQEVAYAERLRTFLTKSGYEVWWDRDLQTGGAWAADLDRALARAACVIVLWSRRAVRSPWVRHEASVAVGRGVYLPVAIERITLPEHFAHFHVAELMGWSGEQKHPGFASVLETLTRVLAQGPWAYELPQQGRETEWPERVPRGLLSELVSWMTGNVASLVAIGALAALAYLTLATEASVRRLDEQVKSTNASFRGLKSELSDSIKGVVEEQKGIAGKLAEQVAAGAKNADELRHVAGLLEHSSSLAGDLLSENAKHQDFLDVHITSVVDVPQLVSGRSHKASVEELQQAVPELPVDEDPKAAREELQQLILDGWQLTVAAKLADGKPLREGLKFNRADVAHFELRHGRGTDTIECDIDQRIRVETLLNLRRYDSFPGAHLSFTVMTFGLRPRTLTCNFGLQDEPSYRSVDFRMENPFMGWTAEVVVPSTYLSSLKLKRR